MPLDGNITDFVTTNPVAQTLRDAAAYIEEHGWCQDKFWKSGGAACLEGALFRVGRADGASYALMRYLKAGPIVWNDTPGRTKAEVLAALTSTAEAVERGDL